MAVSNDSETKIDVQPVPVVPSAPASVEPSELPPSVEPASGGGIARMPPQVRREDLVQRGSLWLRGIALLFSLISFLLVASNDHGDWEDFDKYQEYRYLLAIAILSTLYTGIQLFRQVQELYTGRNLIRAKTAAFTDFFGDQIVAYLLISSASSAIPITNRMREGADNIFTDTSTAAISMSIFAFLCLALSAIISGYKLSTQTYI